ncbi:protein bric-a-brac 2 isoform X3 [Halyomorpha halys]|uniref:protein bric-a-brac 2 isoform X3 n=1 Tax=Halyomorpha halys TaxID=286706 RepID=UPI0034D1E382
MAASKETQQFCVRWNSYQSNLQSAFPKLLTNEHFVDVTLACESRMVKCHKVVLSACSAYFEKLLVQNPCQHPIIFMKDMKYWEVQALVDFMYKGEVNVTQEELASLLKAAEALEVRGLCGQHEQGMAEKLTLPRGTEAAHDPSGQKKRRMDSEVKEINTPPNGDSNNSGSHLNQMKTGVHDQTKNEHHTSTPSTPSGAHVKQEAHLADNGLFEDLDDDFYQDDNSLQIDETGSAYSLAGPSVQLDSSPVGERPTRHSEWRIDRVRSPPYRGATSDAGSSQKIQVLQQYAHLLSTQHQYKQYSQETLERAVLDLKLGKFSSIRACARHHGIPMTTLRYRAKVMAFFSRSN